MNAPSARPPADPPIFARVWALRFGAVFLVGFAVLLVFIAQDAGRRTDLETSSEVTAVGDAVSFTLPAAPAKPPLMAATLDAKPLYLTDAKPINIRDTHVARISRDVSRGLSIYRPGPSATDEERDRAGKGKNAYLLRVRAGQFVKVQAAER